MKVTKKYTLSSNQLLEVNTMTEFGCAEGIKRMDVVITGNSNYDETKPHCLKLLSGHNEFEFPIINNTSPCLFAFKGGSSNMEVVISIKEFGKKANERYFDGIFIASDIDLPEAEGEEY